LKFFEQYNLVIFVLTVGRPGSISWPSQAKRL